MHDKPLLPSGLHDRLPPEAARCFSLTHTLVNSFMDSGYQLVMPPLMEFEESLLTGKDDSVANRSFRVMDPDSQRMLALRADMTGQVARIASGALADEPRPLKLCYSGNTVRVAPEGLHKRRQYTQAGIELFGAKEVQDDATIIADAAATLQKAGMKRLSVDINLPCMVEHLLHSLPEDVREHVTQAVRAKDVAAVNNAGATVIAGILASAGPADKALAALRELAIDKDDLPQIDYLAALVDELAKRAPDVPVSIDVLEIRGFSYYSGISFSLFSTEHGVELGRGGRYTTALGEEATGFTLYIDDVVKLVA